MKYIHLYIAVFLLLSTVRVSAQFDSVDSLTSSVSMLREVIAFADSVDGRSLADTFVARTFGPDYSSNTSVSIDNYYQSPDTLSTISHQTVVSVTRRQALFGVNFNIGGNLFLYDGNPDFDRSGITFSFDRRNYLEELKDEFDIDPEREELARLFSVNEDLLLARYSTFFDDYVSFTQTPQYKQLYVEATRVADSLRGYVADEFDDSSLAYIAVKQKLDQLSEYHRSIVSRLQSIPYGLRSRSQSMLDSARLMIDHHRESLLQRKLRATGKLDGLQRLLLATKQFSIGNTRLADNNLTSIGLPIRGINYTYEKNGLSATVVLGKRIVSNRFVPREGIAYHDLYKGFRVGQLSFGYSFGNSTYDLSVTASSEQSNAAANGVKSIPLPRSNRVVTFDGESAIGEHGAMLTSFSHSATRVKGTNAGPADGQPTQTGDLAMRMGFELSSDRFAAALTAFRTGATYRSFANPYLYTDYQGVEGSLSSSGLGGFLDASFSLAGGYGTTDGTEDDFRLRAQGQVNLHFSKSSSLLLIVSPNVYRYTVTGQEGLSESSVYNAMYQLNTTVFGKPVFLNVGGTNLNQGIRWADSTTVSNSFVGTASGVLAFSEGSSLSFDVQHNLGVSDSNGSNQYNYGLKATHGKKVNVGLGLNYGIYAFEATPSWGGNCDIQLALSKWALVRLNVYYRPTTGVHEGPSSIPQLISQQSWQANF